VVLALVATVLAAGCGAARQDARELKGEFHVHVLGTSFPVHQVIATPATFELRVQNAGSRALSNIAVTIDSFSYTSNYARLAAAQRPVWVVEQGPGPEPPTPVESETISPPGGGQTAYVNTWALGRLAPESTATFEWRVIPVKAGRYTVHYTVAAGLAGRARAVASTGSLSGALTANIAGSPPLRHVNPATGKVEPGRFPSIP